MISGPPTPIFLWVFFVGSNAVLMVVLWKSHRALIRRTEVEWGSHESCVLLHGILTSGVPKIVSIS